MNKRLVFSAYITLSALAATAQTETGNYRWNDATQLWRQTQNASALTVDSGATRGVVRLDYEHSGGDFYRVQQGKGGNSVQLFTERYQPISKTLYGYGRFSFNMSHEKDRSWADVSRPYNSNPFFVGSSRKASYDDWNIDLAAAVATKSLNGWRIGMKLDYRLGDLTRLLDPRSRSETTNYRITPAISYTHEQHTVGLSAYYDRRKEKIPSVSMLSEADYNYYLMSGLENAQGILSGYNGFNREWVNHQFGAELSYGYRNPEGFSTVNTIGISRGSEGVYGTYKYEPGHFYDYHYTFSTQNRLQSDNLLHEIDFNIDVCQAYADEYHQQLVVTTDSVTGYKSYRYDTQIEFKKRYQVQTLALSARYQLDFTRANAINGYVGLTFAMNNASNKHLLRDSKLSYGGADLTLVGGKEIAHRLWIDAQAGMYFAKDAELSLYDESTDYAQQVLIPDMQVLKSSYTHARLKLTYQFPLTVKKRQSTWFVSAFAEALRTNKPDGYTTSLNRRTFGISLGIFN